jgi:hypothetical protein
MSIQNIYVGALRLAQGKQALRIKGRAMASRRAVLKSHPLV